MLSHRAFANRDGASLHAALDTTYEDLRNVSPMLASRNGLDTAEMSMADVAAKLAELVAVQV
jgi:hypothetical protein